MNDRLRRRCGLSTQLLHSYSVTFEEEDGPLAYLCGRTIRSELPESFTTIERELSQKNKNKKHYGGK